MKWNIYVYILKENIITELKNMHIMSLTKVLKPAVRAAVSLGLNALLLSQ